MKKHIHLNSEEKFLIRIIIIVIIGLMMIGYGKFVRNQTIQSAELTGVTDSGYSISFNGEEHYYSFS